MTLLCGTLFGAVRAFLITSISEIAALAPIGILFQSYTHVPASLPGDPLFLSFFLVMPFTAGIVGFLYDRRLYASWGKSFLTLLLGSAIFIIWLVVISLAESPTVISSSQDPTGFYIAAVFFCIIISPLLALPVAGIEGGIHSLIARHKK